MFGKYYYNRNIRNIVVLFGTLFNDISIRRTLSDGTVQQKIKIPIAYGPTEKYLARIDQLPLDETSERVAITLPRMSFEITSMAYDGSRKLQSTQKIRNTIIVVKTVTVTNGGTGYTTTPSVVLSKPELEGGVTATATAALSGDAVDSVTITNAGSGYLNPPTVLFNGGGGTGAAATVGIGSDTESLNSVFNPVPYNFMVDLSIMVKNSDDGAQILEQILPYFTPEFQVTINEMKTMGIKRDVPIVLTGMSTEDTYEGDFQSRRVLLHTLNFEVQGYIYGLDKSQGIIREVNVNTGFNFNNETEANLNVKPDPLTAGPDDDFGFTVTRTNPV